MQNWEEKVNKNEIIIFSEKIEVASAQKGFFIAKSFTTDAIAQAKKNARMRLLMVSEFPTGNVPLPFDFHIIILETAPHIELTFEWRIKSDTPQTSRIKPEDAIILDGKSVSLQVIALKWSQEICGERSNSFRSERAEEGIHPLIVEGKMDFEEGRLLVDGRDIAAVRYKCEFSLRVARPPVVSHFNIENRGRSIQLAPVSIDQNSLQVRLTLPERRD